MLIHQDLTAKDYIAALRRHLWTIAIAITLGPLVGYVISRMVPATYTSQSMILVEQPKVPENYVKPLVSSDLTARLAAMQEQILSRSRLQPVIEQYGLYRDDLQRGVAMEDVVNQMRQGVLVATVQFPIQPTTKSFFSSLFHISSTTSATGTATTTASTLGRKGSSTEQAPGFTVSFTYQNAQLAQQVAAQLTSMFTRENIQEREQQAQGTTDFVSTELGDAKRKLDEQDARLAEFKRRYIGLLPDEQQTNLQMLTTLNTRLGTSTELLGRAEQDKAFAESMLAQELAAWRASLSGKSQMTLQEQLNKAKQELTQLKARYTSDHPDVLRAEDTIAKMGKEVADQAASEKDKPVTKAEDKAVEPTQIQQLRAQLHQAEEGVRVRTREQEKLEEQIKLYQSRIQMTPLVEQQFKDLTRDYNTALKFYNDLLANKNQSQMSSDLERRQQGEQFRLLDPASLPETPSFPDPTEFSFGGLALGIAFGLGLAVLQELRDRSLRTDRDVKFCLGLPTLVMVPTIETGKNSNGRWWLRSRKEKEAETPRMLEI